MIKDSGNRTEFETGAVRDVQEGKGRCDLMPLDVVCRVMMDDVFDSIEKFKESSDVDYLYDAMDKAVGQGMITVNNQRMFPIEYASIFLEVSKHFEEGAEKYGENNWQKGIPVKCYIDSAVRHYLKCLRGDEDEEHYRAFYWNIMCCIWTVTHLGYKYEV